MKGRKAAIFQAGRLPASLRLAYSLKATYDQRNSDNGQNGKFDILALISIHHAALLSVVSMSRYRRTSTARYRTARPMVSRRSTPDLPSRPTVVRDTCSRAATCDSVITAGSSVIYASNLDVSRRRTKIR